MAFRLLNITFIALLYIELPLYFTGNLYALRPDTERFDWNIIRTLHFDLYYPDEMEKLAEYTARTAEDSYVYIANYLKYELNSGISIVIYPSHREQTDDSINYKIICNEAKNILNRRISLSFDGSYTVFKELLTGEITCIFINDILNPGWQLTRDFSFTINRIPGWLIKGIKDYISIGFDENSDMVTRDLILNGHTGIMNITGIPDCSYYILKNTGISFWYFFDRIYGKKNIARLLTDMADSGFAEGIMINTNKTPEDLNTEWIGFFRKRYSGLPGKNETGKDIVSESGNLIAPAVSPDGKNIVCINIEENRKGIFILDHRNSKSRFFKADIPGRIDNMDSYSGKISWTQDSKYIVFAANYRGKSLISFMDLSGSIVKEIQLPFRKIMDPYLSKDGGLIAFIGQRNESSDLYVYYINENKLSRITSDLFSERFPAISPDNSFIVFSSNWNTEGDINKEDHDIFRADISGGKSTILIYGNGNDIHPDIANDNIVYVSNRTGIYNLYIYNLKTDTDKIITDVTGGVFQPRWLPDAENIVFSAYRNLSSHILVKDAFPVEIRKNMEIHYERCNYSGSYFDYKDAVNEQYSVLSETGFNYEASGIFWDSGLAGHLLMDAHDFMENHRLSFSAYYLRNKDDNVSDIDMSYDFLNYPWAFGTGLFFKNDDILKAGNEYFGEICDESPPDYYGISARLNYLLFNKIRMDMRISAGKFDSGEIISEEGGNNNSIFTTLLSVDYDNVLYSNFTPINGLKGKIFLEHSLDITGNDPEYREIYVEIIDHLQFGRRFIISSRGIGGITSGKDSEMFKYRIGGFNTLRGHSLYGYTGSNIFLFTVELRLLYDGVSAGQPAFYRSGIMETSVFFDCGSAWDDDYSFINSGSGDFDDFKSDIGLSFRYTQYPMLFRLDLALPWFYKSIGNGNIYFSFGYEY